MRVECERCHAIVVADFDVDPEGVTVSCSACGGTFRAEARRHAASAAAATSAASASRDDGCVKCGAPSTADAACPRCGLARDRAAAWAAAEPPPPAELVAAWSAAEAAWTEPAAHDRAAAIALERAALPWLARRYRDAQRTRPDDAIARARLDRLGFMTVAAVHATAAVPASPRRRGGLAYVLVVVGVLALAAVVLAAKLRTERRAPARRPAVPGARLVHPRPAPPPSAAIPAPAASGGPGGPRAPAPFEPAPVGR